MLDPIADMLTRIRNAQQAGLKEVVLPASKIKWSIAKILEAKGFLEKTEKIATGKFPELRLVLRYVQVTPTQRNPAIRALERVSRQGQRIYVKRDQIRRVKNGFGLSIVSTPKGLMTGEEAYHSGLGGEYICRIW